MTSRVAHLRKAPMLSLFKLLSQVISWPSSHAAHQKSAQGRRRGRCHARDTQMRRLHWVCSAEAFALEGGGPRVRVCRVFCLVSCVSLKPSPRLPKTRTHSHNADRRHVSWLATLSFARMTACVPCAAGLFGAVSPLARAMYFEHDHHQGRNPGLLFALRMRLSLIFSGDASVWNRGRSPARRDRSGRCEGCAR